LSQPVGIKDLMFKALQIQGFDFLPRPRCLAQKFQAGLDARLMRKTIDLDGAAELIPTILFHKTDENFFQCYAMQWIVWLMVRHETLGFLVFIKHGLEISKRIKRG